MARTCLALAAVLVAVVAATMQTTVAQQRNRRPSPAFKKKSSGLELPNNATSIRENIVDTFSCDDRIYGYYADIDNECQIFHICLPQARNFIRFSFICPAETVFNQATFVCTRTESSIPCEESEKYYVLNEQFGKVDENTEETTDGGEGEATTLRPARPGSTQRPTKPATPGTQRPGRPTQRPTTTQTDYPTTLVTQRPAKPTQKWRQ